MSAGGVTWRAAERADVPAIVALLREDDVAPGRESAAPEAYLAAFDRIRAGEQGHLVVGEEGGRVVAAYQLTVLRSLAHGGAARGLLEGVRVAAGLRSRGVGRHMMEDAAARARALGCVALQLTTDRRRERAHRFYEACGFVPSHAGYRRSLA